MSNRQSVSSVASLLNRVSQQLGGKTPNDSLRSSSASYRKPQRQMVKSSWQDDDDDDVDEDAQAYLNDLSKKAGMEDSKRKALKDFGLDDLSFSDSEMSDKKSKPVFSGTGSKFLKPKAGSTPQNDAKQASSSVSAARASDNTRKVEPLAPRKTEESRKADEVPEIDLEQLSSGRLSSADSPKRSSLRMREESAQKRMAEKRTVSFESKQAIGEQLTSESDSERPIAPVAKESSVPAAKRVSEPLKVVEKSLSESIADEVDDMFVVKPTYSSSSASSASDSESQQSKKPFSFNVMTIDDLDRPAPLKANVRKQDPPPAEQTPRSVHTDSSRSRKSERSRTDDTVSVDYSNTFEDDDVRKKDDIEKEKPRHVFESETSRHERSESTSSSSDSRKRGNRTSKEQRRRKTDSSQSLSTRSYSDDDRSLTSSESRSERRHRRERHGRSRAHNHMDMQQVQMSITRALTDTLIARLTNAVASSINGTHLIDRQHTQSHSYSLSQSHSVLHAETRTSAVNPADLPFFNQLLAQQVGFTQQSLADQQRLYAECSLRLQPDYRYETLQDVKQFCATNRDRHVRVRTFDEALQEVLNEN